jgi:capsular polysaccharide biosynthesis protein
MKLKPIHGAYVCNTVIVLLVMLGVGVAAAIFTFFVLTGTITFCQAEWDKKC